MYVCTMVDVNICKRQFITGFCNFHNFKSTRKYIAVVAEKTNKAIQIEKNAPTKYYK